MMRAPRLSRRLYSTSALPAGDRHEAWVNRAWPSIAPVYRTTPLEAFDTSSESFQLGEIAVHFTTMTAQRWERNPALRRSRDAEVDALAVAITIAGEARGTMADRAFRTGPGSVQLTDLAQNSLHDSTASRTIFISIPRGTARARGLDVAALHGRVLQSGAAAMLGPHLLGVREAADELTVEDGALLGGTFLDLLGLAVETSSRPARRTGFGREAAAVIARAAIEEGLGAPSQTISGLCRQLGMSRTSLHRLFENEGGVQAYIRGRRLEAVRRALLDPACREPLYALAERMGFSDAAHLSRLFRARYDISPSDYRALGGDPD
jgi:AraC-like DNA-binding protein